MELGRLPIQLDIFKSMLKFWFRLVTLPKSRLVSHCYWALFEKADIKDDWIHSIKNIIGSSGFCHYWTDQKLLHQLDPNEIQRIITSITKSFKDQFLQNAISEISDQNKLYLYKNVGQSSKISPHLSFLNTRKKRSLTTKLRLGSLKLEIETGRWTKVNRNERFCKLCSNGSIENEPHFIFDCPALEQIRQPLLNNLQTFCPASFLHWSSEEKLKYLFFNNKLDKPTLDCA